MRLTDGMIRYLGTVLSGEQFAAMLLLGREEARAARAARRAARNADSVRVSESGFVAPPAVPVSGGVLKDRARAGLLRPAGLTGAMLAVAALILDNYRLATGRCDIGIDTMAARLGLADRSVRRALAALDARGLVAREIHGGRHHANAYRPNFEALARLGLGVPPDRNPDSEAKPGLNRTNESAKTESLSQTPSSPRKVQRARDPDRRQLGMMLPIAGGKAPGRAGIARDQARMRLGAAYRAHLGRLGKAGAADFVASVTEADWEAALAAEVAGKGTGLQAMLDSMFERWAASTGPPAAAATA